MENFILPGTHIVPSIDFDHKSGLLKITGRLISVSSQEYHYFIPIIEWLENYALNPSPETKMIINLEFCSSAGIKNIFQLFKILEKLHLEGYDVSVEWNYYIDDEDSRDKGNNFIQLLNLPFKVVVNPER